MVGDAPPVIEGGGKQRAEGLGDHAAVADLEGLGVAPLTGDLVNAHQAVPEDGFVAVKGHW